MANIWKMDYVVVDLGPKFDTLLKMLKKERQPADDRTNAVDKALILATPESNVKIYNGENPRAIRAHTITSIPKFTCPSL